MTADLKLAMEENKKKRIENQKLTQFVLFQRSMKTVMVVAQCVGLIPVLGVTRHDLSKVKFTIFSVRFLYAVLILTAQVIAACLCFNRLMRNALSIGALGFFSFYLSGGCTTLLCLKVASRWPKLLREVYYSNLNEFVDKKMIWKCNGATCVLLLFAIAEHIFSLINKFVLINDCKTNETVIYDEYMKLTFPWLIDANVTFYLPLDIFLQLLVFVSTITWSYVDLFVICVSMYLTSILEKINKKILAASRKTDLTPSSWRYLRESYNNATQLVRYFDEVISGIVFMSFAINLFFICLQLFNILVNGITSRQGLLHERCPNFPSGPFRGYEYTVYLIFSLCFLLGRSLAVSLCASRVHIASTTPAAALYDVPSCMYSEEIRRFIDQIHGDKVALTGLHFFYVTRELALSMAGTIITYELVLLQFSTE